MNKIKILTILTLFCVSVNLYAKSAAEVQEQNRTVSEYCKRAMESFYKGEYTSAIRQWEEVLKIDPRQAQVQKLIELARQKMVESIKPLREEVWGLVRKGDFLNAYKKNKELLALDPTNKYWKKRGDRLEMVSKIIPNETGKGKSAGMLRQSAAYHLTEDENPRIALNSARYAWQLSPKNTGYEAYKNYIEKDYKVLAEAERIVPGMNIIQQKLQSVLNGIYEAKYDRAILECNDVLALEPGNILALKRAGSAYYASGNKKKAKEMWARASKISPKDKELKKFLRLK